MEDGEKTMPCRSLAEFYKQIRPKSFSLTKST